MKNYVVDYLRITCLALTVENYLEIAYMGEVRSLRQLEADYPEDFAEVRDLIEDRILVDEDGL